MSTSREVVRDALVTLLNTALVGTGLPVKTVRGSKATTLEGLTPLVEILSSGTIRKRVTFMGEIPTFYLGVYVWVLQQGTGWTTAQSEDALDRIEAIIGNTYANNAGTINWSLLEQDGRTTINEATVDGKLYYREYIPTIVRTTKS